MNEYPEFAKFEGYSSGPKTLEFPKLYRRKHLGLVAGGSFRNLGIIKDIQDG